MSIAPAVDPKSNDDARIRVMIVDDSAVVRGIFRRTLEADPDIVVAASVNHGRAAVESLARRPVDVILLDIEMPEMDGLTALPKLLEIDPGVQVIMASTLTQRNADISIAALAAGAADYIPKPEAKHVIHSSHDFKRELLEKVKTLGRARPSRRRGAPAPVTTGTPGPRPASAPDPAPSLARDPSIKLRPASQATPEILCIGSSTGGPQALIAVLGKLPRTFDLPILITQHMPKTFTSILAQHLERACGRHSAEAVDGETIERGRIYVAPGEWHMVVEEREGRRRLRLDNGPPENYCKPAVDPMLRSAAAVYRDRLLTLILTGMGQDGMLGGKAVVEAGGTVIAQDRETSVVWGMPGAVANAGVCSAVIPLQEIALHLTRFSGRTTT